MKVCVLIPIYNEAKYIEAVVASLKEEGLDIIVVDDGSTDGSGKIAEKNGAEVICHEQRHGKGFSLKKGFAHILKREYEGVLIMDGDGQHDVKDISKFLKAATLDPDAIIVGNRFSSPQEMPVIRYVTNRLMSSMISLACGQKIPDTQCGFRYISCSVLKRLSLKSNGFQLETEILMKACKKKIPIYSVPIKTIYEDEVSKINPFKDTFRFIIYFLKELCSR